MLHFRVAKYKRISDKDIIYILGDIAYPRNVNDVFKVVEVVKSLKGHKILIQGNHDWRLVKYKGFCDLFQEITIYKEITDNNHRVILFHYPIEDWNYKYYGALHVHGHIHNNKAFNRYDNRFNASVDVNQFCPVTLNELIARRINNGD